MKINDLHRHLHAPPDLYWTWFSVALFFWVAFNGANNELPKTNASNFCICNFFSDLHLFISTFSFLSKNSKTFHIGLPLERHLKHKNINFESGCSHVHLGKSVRIAQVIHMHTLKMVTSTELFYIPWAFCSHVSCLSVCVCVRVWCWRVLSCTPSKARILTICKLEAEMLMLIFRVTRIQYGNVSVWWGKMYMYNHLEIFNWEWERKIRFNQYWMGKWWNWEKK